MNAPLRRGLCALVLGGLSLATVPAQASIFQPIAGQTVEQLSSTLSITVADPDTGLTVTFDNFQQNVGSPGNVDAFDAVTVVAGIFVPTGELALSFVINGLIANGPESLFATFDYDVTVTSGFADSAGVFLDGSSVDGSGNTAVEVTLGTGGNGAGAFDTIFAEQEDDELTFADTTTFDPRSTFVASLDLNASANDAESIAHLSAFIQTYGFTTVIPEPSTVAVAFGGLALFLALGMRRLRPRRA
ncbi:MAG: hypothetical protein ACFB20_05245 [Opitutales bacterium]